MTEYELKTDEDGNIVECDCCQYPAPTAVHNGGVPREEYKLCEVCFNTFLSNAVVYPRHVSDPALYQSIGWIANKILDEVRKR